MRQYILLLTNYPCFESDNVWAIVFKMDNFVNCRLQYNIDHWTPTILNINLSNVEMCINNSEYKFSA